tara:strand:+ start:1997 stop:3319 length:1323 start_codon:yes stop_codon:yes gene_type:complete
VFEDLQLDRRLQLGLEALQLSAPTEVQARVVPRALQGVDLCVSAETGSGKTLAYLLPAVQNILRADYRGEGGTLALVLVPTRELARQVLRECRKLLQRSPLTVQAITGGADFRYQSSLLRKDPEILVATPGRLREHCERGSAQLGALQTLVLDEADRMLDMGLREDVLAICARCAPGRQVIMLSATLRHRGVAAVAQELLQAPETIQVGESRQAHGNIHHQLVLADGQEHKDQLLPALLRATDFRRALVFANKRSAAARLARLLQGLELRSECLHGEMSSEERKRVMDAFREGRTAVLCASDVAARGLDVPGIDLVINYDMPHSGDDYVHRTGRSARAGESGLAVSFVSAPEWNLMISISRYLGLDFERRALPGLKARYHGPKKTKGSGKAVGKKKGRKERTASGKTRAGKKARKPGATPRRAGSENDGFAPLKRKKPAS